MNLQATTRPRIALLVDNPYRDLPGLVLIAWRLCQKGATCYFLPMNLRHQEIWPLAPDFILLNHFRTIYEGLVGNLLSTGIMVGVLDTEGSIFSPLPAKTDDGLEQPEPQDSPLEEYALSMARDAGLRHNITRFFAWNQTFADYASREGWYLPNQITVTGTPRMDFYASQWRQAARRMSPYAESYPTPLILINSSFTLANPAFQNAEKEAEMMISNFSYDREYIEKWKHAQATALDLLTSLANRLAKHFPRVTFIFRPHPFENEATYREILKPLPNLHLVKQGTVDGWLLRAKALIHWGSSTAIDSCLSGVPAFTAGWIPVHLPIPPVDSVSISCPSEEVLLTNIEAVLNNSFVQPPEIAGNIDAVIEESFYKIDGRAHERVADTILEAVLNNRPEPDLNKCHDKMYYGADSLIGRITGGVKKTLHLSPMWSLRHLKNIAGELNWDKSAKHFDAQQVISMINAIAASEAAASGKSRPKVEVQSAHEHGDYHFGYSQGRSIAVFPQRGDV